MLPPLGTALCVGVVTGIGGIVTYTAFKAVNSGEEKETMSTPRTEEERKSFHERIFGKGSTPPAERLGRGQTVNSMMPMPPEQGPPLPRMFALKWPWIK